jgi:hypothetical protein
VSTRLRIILPLPLGNAAIFTYGVARDNAGDQRLSRAAFNYGIALGLGQSKLKI